MTRDAAHPAAHAARRHRWPLRRRLGLAGAMLLIGLLLVAYLLAPILRLLNVPPHSILAILGDREVSAALWLTLFTAAVATLIGTAFAIPLGYGLARLRFPGRRPLTALLDLPLILPHPVAGIALLLLFARGTLAGRLLAFFHLHLVGSVAGIVAAMVFVSVPYQIHACRDGFRNVDPRYEQLARTLGATSWQAFARIALPLAWRQIVSGAILTSARAASEFGALMILVYHPRVISILIFDRFNTYGVMEALPIAALLIIFGLLVIWAVSALEGVQP